MVNRVFRIGEVNCQYIAPIIVGHEELLKFNSGATDCVDMVIAPVDEIDFEKTKLNDKYKKVFECENLTIFKEDNHDVFYLFFGTHIVAKYSKIEKVCLVNLALLNKNGYALPFPLEDFLWTDAIYNKDCFILHGGAASAINSTNSFLYFGESGAGKSTLSSLLQRNGYAILSDERVIISPYNKKINPAYWLSSNGVINNICTSSQTILCLKHSNDKNNHLKEILPTEMFDLVSKQVFYPTWDRKNTIDTINKIQSFLSQTSCYIYEFVPNETAVEYLCEKLL